MSLAANNSARRHQRVCAERFIKSKNPRDFVFVASAWGVLWCVVILFV